MQTPNHLSCKCCDHQAELIGSLDFNKSCNDRHGPRTFPVSAEQVPYYRCPKCGFIFTSYCDAWTKDDFTSKIYNDTYRLADPLPEDEGTEGAESGVGLWLARLLAGQASHLRLLDFGAGGSPGHVGRTLLNQHFDVTSYEPFFVEGATNLQGTFNFIYAIEVLEHCVDPLQSAHLISKHLDEHGLLFIRTFLHPQQAGPGILNSWYIAPRNGHISIHTLLSLAMLFARVGINIVQHPFGIVGFKKLPNFPSSFFILHE